MSQFPTRPVTIGSLEPFRSATSASSSVINNEDQRSDKAISPQPPLDLREGAGAARPDRPGVQHRHDLSRQQTARRRNTRVAIRADSFAAVERNANPGRRVVRRSEYACASS